MVWHHQIHHGVLVGLHCVLAKRVGKCATLQRAGQDGARFSEVSVFESSTLIWC